MVGIYKITNPSGKVYIGQSLRIETRLSQYKYAACKNQRHLHSSILKHGWEKHSFEVVHQLPEDVNQEVLNAYETFYWQQYRDCKVKMLNIREPGSKGRISEETKLKWKGRIPHNKGKTGELDPKWGKKWSKEKTEKRLQTRMLNGANERVSQKMKGKVKTKEHQDKINKGLTKPLIHVESGIVYNSRAEAAKALKLAHPASVGYHIRKGTFKYVR
jgi:group I intron endonuclease